MSRSWISFDHFSCGSVDCAGAGEKEETPIDLQSGWRISATWAELGRPRGSDTYLQGKDRVLGPACLSTRVYRSTAAGSSSLGGVGSVGTISAALALSSRNLSNSGRSFHGAFKVKNCIELLGIWTDRDYCPKVWGWFLMLFKEVSYVHNDCIYLIKNTVNR